MPAPKRRRWFSLSLRTLLIGMTLISVVFGWFLHHRNQRIAERERLYEQFSASPIEVTFGDAILGCELPDPESTTSDRWWWLRLVAVPQLQKVDLHRDELHPHSEELASLARRAAEVWLWDQGLPYSVGEVVSPNTRILVICDEVPADDVAAIEHAPNLRELTCFDFTLNENALRAVLAHPRLEEVDVIADADELANMPAAQHSNLTKLAVHFYVPASKQDGEYAWLSTCSRLETIEISETEPQFLVQVGRRLGGVPHLTLNGGGSVVEVDRLSEWRRLRHLTLYLCELNDQLLLRLCELCPDLESLDIFGWAGMFTPDGLRVLQRLPRLRRLGLERCELGKEHVTVLATLAQVEELSLYDNPLDDAAVAPLGKLPRLKLLDLDDTEVTSGMLSGIRGKFKPRWSGF